MVDYNDKVVHYDEKLKYKNKHMMEKKSFKNFRLFFMVFALSIYASITFAVPGDGWGLYVDIGQLKAVNENTESEYQKSKISKKKTQFSSKLL